MGLAERYASVAERIERAAQKSGRSASAVELIVITKMHPVSVVAELYDLGHRVFGENKDQEAAPKAAALSELGKTDAQWHFVGQLQSNKAKSVIRYASCIHSIDRESLVLELAKQLDKNNKRICGFLELNLTGDPGRGGVEPSNLIQLAEKVLETGVIDIQGVMGVAGLGVDPRVDFERVISSSEELQKLIPGANKLSMGMSEDFEVAIELGATHVRIGSAITGPRPTNA